MRRDFETWFDTAIVVYNGILMKWADIKYGLTTDEKINDVRLADADAVRQYYLTKSQRKI